MSAFLLGGSTPYDVVSFGKLRMWAERGLIHIEDGDTGEYEAISVRTCLQRMSAIQDMLKNSRADRGSIKNNTAFMSITIEKHQRMLDCMVEVVGKAKVQGMPSDASARRDLVRRRPKSVVVPAYGGGM